MARARMAALVLAGLVVTRADARPRDAANLEQRIYELVRAGDERKRAGAADEVPAILRQIAALDPEHPKAYIQAVLLQSERGKIQDAPALMDTLGPRDGPGRTYGNALIGVLTGQLEEAHRGFALALEEYTARGHIAGQAACHTAFGNIARSRDPDETAREFGIARDLLERIGDRHGLGDILDNMSDLDLSRRHEPMALETYRRALAIQKEIGDERGAARSHQGIGRCLLAAGDTKGAVASFRWALAIRRRERDVNGVVSSLDLIATAHEASKEWSAALDARRSAIQVAATVPDTFQQAMTHRRLGDTLLRAKRRREAVTALATAATLFGEAGNRSREARALGALGAAWSELGELRRARVALEPALDKAREAKDRQAEGDALRSLGNLAVANGDLAHALVIQNQALAIAREVKDRQGELSNVNNIGAIYFELGQRTRARQYAQDGLRVAEELENLPAQAQARNNLGVLMAEEGRLDASLEELQRSVAIKEGLDDQRSLALGRANIAEVLMHLGRRDEASTQLLSALAGMRRAGDLAGEAYALNLSGEIRLLQGDTTGALDAHRRALRLAGQADLADERWRAHAGLASALEAAGRRAEAAGEINRAIDEVENVRTGLVTSEFKMRFLSGKVGLYERALAGALPLDRGPAGHTALSSGFRIAEQARARGLLDRLERVPSATAQALPDDLQKRQTVALDELGEHLARLARAQGRTSRAAARRGVEEARDRLDRLQIEIQGRTPGGRGLLQARTATLEEVQQHILRDGEVLLEYFVGADRAWLWKVERGRASLYPLGSPREITSLVSAFLDAIRESGRGLQSRPSDLDAAGRLALAILPPDGLPSGTRLLVVPDGPLHHIPFEALSLKGRFLLESHEVTIVPSATVLGSMRRRAPAASRAFLGVGGALTAAPADSLEPLPYARQELETLARFFPAPDRLILTGEDATRAKIRALDFRRFRFLHFATHGWLETGDVQDSGLWLSPASPGSPAELLSADDILSLELDSDLAVLSACSSGIGEQLSAEGLVGLTRAFLHAGSRGVIVSLWDVPDQSTADLMRDFYQGLMSGKPAPAALREVKLRFLSSDVPGRGRILRWAPFVFVGDPGS